MRQLLCLLAIAGASMAFVGCGSESSTPAPSADTKTDLGEPTEMDGGAGESAGSTTN
jgi:hypothetical protein